MFRVIGCVTVDHDLRLVVLAGLLCLFAAFTAMELLTRARAAQGRGRSAWILAAGTVAGCGIWATHFVAMLAYQTSMPVSYDLALTTLSIVTAVAMATCGLWVTITKRDALWGGVVFGSAIGSMHYIGMAAVQAPALISWDASYVVASLAIGIALTASAMIVAMRGEALSRTAAAAGLLTLAICGLHFTAMTAVTMTPMAAVTHSGPALEPTSLALAIAAIAMLIIGLGFTGTMVDRHLGHRSTLEAERLRAHVAELEATKRSLEATSKNLSRALAAASASSQAKSQFLAAMSHELRTPLNAILGYSELMTMELQGPLGHKSYTEYMHDIHASGLHLLALINDVLDLARLDANRMDLEEGEFDLGELVEETLRAVTLQAGEMQLSLERNIATHLPRLRADRRRIKQVLLNLVSNAVKFTSAGGRVRVSIAHGADGLSVAVSDTGIGMKPEDIPVALDRFGQIDSTLARKYEGTGLGLPLAKQLVELHGGKLSVESALDVGTTVTVTFPPERVVDAGRNTTVMIAAAAG